MTYNILFQTKEGACLVFICVGKYVDIESQLKDRTEHEIFETKEDVANFMDRYIASTTRNDYYPYWQFEDIITI